MHKNENIWDSQMHVKKRDGSFQEVKFDKILARVKKMGIQAGVSINFSALVIKIIDQIYDCIPTTKIDELTAEQCATQSSQNPDYGTLASYIIMSNHHKNTKASFNDVMSQLYFHTDNTCNMEYSAPLISHNTWINISKNAVELEEMIDYNRDYLIDYFGFKTLERAYLFRIHNQIVERIQHMWMRVAISIHLPLNESGPRPVVQEQSELLVQIKETYDLLSQKYYIVINRTNKINRIVQSTICSIKIKRIFTCNNKRAHRDDRR
jgi:hypothetical protein